MLLAHADAADYVSQSAGTAAQSLREVDEDVAQGDRNELGVKNVPEEEKFKNQDAKEQWERSVDTVKVAGSKTIGAGQVAIQTTEDLANRSTERLQNAFYKASTLITFSTYTVLMKSPQICDRAQENQEYHDSVSTIFDILGKWIHKSLDTAGDVNMDTSLESFIDDPTPDQHLIKAIRAVRAFIERNANGKSLDDFFNALRVCGVDIQKDQTIRSLCDDLLEHLRKSLDEPGYVRSQEAEQRRKDRKKRWNKLMNGNTEEGRKWKEDFELLQKQWDEFSQELGEGEDLRRLKQAQAKLGEDIETAIGEAATEGAQKAMDQPVWMWQDLFNAYLPRLLSMVKDIPIPRYFYRAFY